MITTQ